MTAKPPSEERAEWGELLEYEHYWRDRQTWLEEHGFLLRPRYRPGWKPPGVVVFREDTHWSSVPTILDTKRIADGVLVTLKAIETDVHPYEVEIGQFLSSEQLASDPHNHCVRILDTLQDPMEPNIIIIVMPYLRTFYDPPFLTFGEAVACCRQLIQGLRFMHENHVAHHDISIENVMMDASVMFPAMWHPESLNMKYDYSGTAKHFTRTERPPKYCYIDFGLSRKYNPNDGPPQELPILGGDKSVPEFQEEGYDKPTDPFRTDIYYLGNVMRIRFVGVRPSLTTNGLLVLMSWKLGQIYRGFEFMWQLIADMVQDDPAKRPSIEEVETHFEESVRTLSTWKLRSRLVGKREDILARGIYGIGHVVWTAKYLIKQLPPVPTPSA